MWDLDSIPGLGRSPGERNGYPLQCSGLENSMDCLVHGVAKSERGLSDFHFSNRAHTWSVLGTVLGPEVVQDLFSCLKKNQWRGIRSLSSLVCLIQFWWTEYVSKLPSKQEHQSHSSSEQTPPPNSLLILSICFPILSRSPSTLSIFSIAVYHLSYCGFLNTFL